VLLIADILFTLFHIFLTVILKSVSYGTHLSTDTFDEKKTNRLDWKRVLCQTTFISVSFIR